MRHIGDVQERALDLVLYLAKFLVQLFNAL